MAMITIEEQIIICAVRYALGRRSYIVGVVCEYVESKISTLSEGCINIIIRDVEEELHRYHKAGQPLGDYCDERDWYRLLELLKAGGIDAE